ncbi:ESX secretion-associated protein EspG [Sciscionella marina]|uniref:ESX secretion-associated protein EspG n=1 Tax=Sciscionella marina TaxID=508770 RepID=UPI00058BFBD0|nr:ESX secretion-associated protein EspG [Sciscionella marina]
MLKGPVSLSHAAYEVLWERSNLGVMPTSIAIHYPLRTMDNGAALARQAFAELNQAGLAKGDQVHPDLEDTLHRLARLRQRYAAMIITPDHPHGEGTLVALDGEAAILATLDDRTLHLAPIPAAQAIPALLSRIPRYAPGNGKSLTFREDELTEEGRRAARQSSAEGSIMVSANVTATDADRYVELMSKPRIGVIYLYPPAGNPVVVVDFEQEGRWFVANKDGWVSSAPGTDAMLAEHLRG